MKELPVSEIKYINNSLLKYGIKYYEIYHEINDHIISSIEDKRRSGDSRNVDLIFLEIIQDDFGGKEGIKDLQNHRLKSIQNKYKIIFGQQLKDFVLSPKALFIPIIYGLIILIREFVMPIKYLNDPLNLALFSTILISCIPDFYLYLRFRVISSNLNLSMPIKRSIIKYTISRFTHSVERIFTTILLPMYILRFDTDIENYLHQSLSSLIGIHIFCFFFTVYILFSIIAIKVVQTDYKTLIDSNVKEVQRII